MRKLAVAILLVVMALSPFAWASPELVSVTVTWPTSEMSVGAAREWMVTLYPDHGDSVLLAAWFDDDGAADFAAIGNNLEDVEYVSNAYWRTTYPSGNVEIGRVQCDVPPPLEWSDPPGGCQCTRVKMSDVTQ